MVGAEATSGELEVEGIEGRKFSLEYREAQRPGVFGPPAPRRQLGVTLVKPERDTRTQIAGERDVGQLMTHDSG